MLDTWYQTCNPPISVYVQFRKTKICVYLTHISTWSEHGGRGCNYIQDSKPNVNVTYPLWLNSCHISYSFRIFYQKIWCKNVVNYLLRFCLRWWYQKSGTKTSKSSTADSFSVYEQLNSDSETKISKLGS